jgi:hypothetical protein
MTGIAAASIAVNGIDGFLEIIACLLFLVALIVAAVVTPRDWWKVGIAGGLLFWLLTLLVR